MRRQGFNGPVSRGTKGLGNKENQGLKKRTKGLKGMDFVNNKGLKGNVV